MLKNRGHKYGFARDEGCLILPQRNFRYVKKEKKRHLVIFMAVISFPEKTLASAGHVITINNSETANSCNPLSNSLFLLIVGISPICSKLFNFIWAGDAGKAKNCNPLIFVILSMTQSTAKPKLKSGTSLKGFDSSRCLRLLREDSIPREKSGSSSLFPSISG